MPYDITWQPRGAIKRFWGYLSAEEFFESGLRITADPRFGELAYMINDFLGVMDHALDRKAIEAIAGVRLGASLKNRALRVAIVSTDPRLVELVKYINSPHFVGAFETRSFASLEAAKRWLGVPPNEQCDTRDSRNRCGA